MTIPCIPLPETLIYKYSFVARRHSTSERKYPVKHPGTFLRNNDLLIQSSIENTFNIPRRSRPPKILSRLSHVIFFFFHLDISPRTRDILAEFAGHPSWQMSSKHHFHTITTSTKKTYPKVAQAAFHFVLKVSSGYSY